MTTFEKIGETSEKFHDIIVKPGRTSEDLNNKYDAWSSAYDTDLANVEYTGPSMLADLCARYIKSKSARILDFGAGTGLVGEFLCRHGFTSVDAHDGSAGMLEQAKAKNVYSNFYVEIVNAGAEMKSVSKESYDAVIACGCIAPSHIGPRHFPGILSGLKHGGLFLCANRHCFADEKSDGQSVLERFDELEQQGYWKAVHKEVGSQFFRNMPGILFAYEKL